MKYPVNGRKELKRLAKRLSVLVEKGLDRESVQVQLLIEKIKFLFSKARFSKRFVRRAFGTALVILGLGFSQQLSAQASFATPVQLPFNLDSTDNFAFTATADLDGDGDNDLLVGEYYGNLQYFQNTGTSTSPSFATAVQNPFGLTAGNGNWAEPSFVDLDNDGDLDLLVSESQYNYTTYAYSGNLLYFENIGSSIAPSFAAPTNSPFGLPNLTNAFGLCDFTDLDNDGDYDLMMVEYNATNYTAQLKYYPNLGSSSLPNFGPAQTNPFGLSLPSNTDIGFLDFMDIDNDGDQDLFLGNSSSYNSNFQFYDNNGSSSVPNFAAGVSNPFGLTPLNQLNQYYSINSLSIVDIDGDSDLDIITGTDYGVLVYYENVFNSTGPLAISNIVLSSPTCNPGGDGSLWASASGGTPPIVYKIGTDSNTTGNFTNLVPGTYTIRVRDSLNTIIDSIVTISTPTPPIFDTNSTFVGNVSCNGLNDGFVFVGANGSASPLTYNLIPGGSNNNGGFQSVGVGNYLVVVTDPNNCSDSLNVTVTQPPAINFGVDSTTNLTCFGATSGALYTTATGGNGGFNYTISPIAGIQANPGDFTNLPAGSYTITATDLNGCSSSVTQTITQPPNTITTIISNLNNVSCFGGNDGSFMATSTGSTGFSYSVVPLVGTQAPSGTFTNLTANNYTVTATDAIGCTNSSVVNITQPIALTLSITNVQGASTGMNDGSITALAAGGTPAVTYSILPNVGTQFPAGTFTGLGLGNYTITATDANNCTTTIMSTVGFVTELRDLEKHNIKVYPNPVVDLLKLESDVEISALSILDITGKVIETIDKPAESISMRNLPEGIYILKLSLKNEGTVYTRITKQ